MLRAQAFHVPVGIEWRKTPDAARTWSWQHTTVGAILVDIAKTYPGYALNATDASIRVSPSNLWLDPGDIVSYRDPSFAINRASVSSAVVKLECQLGPIIHAHRPNEPTAACSASILGSSADRLMTFAMKDVPVGVILDRLSIESERNVWVVTYGPDDIRTNAGFLIPLHPNGAVPPDDWQLMPYFDFPLPAPTRR